MNTRVFILVPILTLLLLCQSHELKGQTFTPCRVEGDVAVFRNGSWVHYTSAKKIGNLQAQDSISLKAGSLLVLRDSELKDYTIKTSASEGFVGTVWTGFSQYKQDRRKRHGNSFILFDTREESIGEPAMVSRGGMTKDKQILSILSRIKEGGKVLKSMSVSITRLMAGDSYYYVVKNTSRQHLFISIIEVEKDGTVVDVDRDLLYLELPAGAELRLDDYSLSTKRKKNGYYVIGTTFLFQEAHELIGCNIENVPVSPNLRDFNYLIAGHR